jgi:hypothetical protein
MRQLIMAVLLVGCSKGLENGFGFVDVESSVVEGVTREPTVARAPTTQTRA